ncbi:structural maintenance of chromosomes protein 6 [Aplysia californica]|uniref:Structural maintenance of chromosomes protein 6 n=1 Tax=Aplysia californica TaxID=6500 RepID=A0ABM1ABY3_APLCA|nr:structural maintenance of chromosomes protein 6 [Aplysia californica]
MSKRRKSPDENFPTASPRKRHRLELEDEEDSGGDENDESVIESSLQDSSTSLLLANGQLARASAACAPVAGVIKRVSMSNFMCHDRLDVVLGSHVNFIVGRNGSGKSAVMTALVLGLGGKASVTSRGNAVKNFVKSGKRSAWVEVVLNNKGKDSYKPHIYGGKIVVHRRFTVEGASSYNIKSEKGQHISDKSHELARITDHLNIQVDNPVSILNQDTSRNFLNSKSATDKFKFFMKATQLEQMSSDYDQVRRKKEGAKQIILDKEQTLPGMRSEVREWETKFKNMTALSELKVKVKHLKHEMAWALVNQKERGLRPMEKTLSNEMEALPRFQKKVEDSKRQVEGWEVRHKEVQERLIECSEEVKSLEPVLQEKKRDIQKAKERLQPIQIKLKECERELAVTRRDRKQCQERIEELRTAASHDYEAERKQREEQIAKLEGQLEKLSLELRVKEHSVEQFRGAVAKNKSDLAAIEAQLKSREHRLRTVENTLGDLRRAKDDRLLRFGAWMPAVLEKIRQNSRKFHRVPIGPLGVCFDLLDSKWAMAVETCLRGLVSSFVCHDHHDERLLLSFFSVCPRSRRPTVIISAFSDHPYNVTSTRCQSDRYQCVLDVLKCDDPMVVNTLIDQRTIERVVLIEDSGEARTVMQRHPPRNARECFTLEGDQVYSEPTFRYYSNDKMSVKFLMADVAEQVKALERDQDHLTKERARLIEQARSSKYEMGRNQQEEKKLLTQCNKNKEQAARIDYDIKELRNMEDPLPVDVTALEEEVRGFGEKEVELKTRAEGLLDEKRVAETDMAAVKESYAAVEASVREKSDCGIPLREEISQAQVEVEKARNERKHYLAKLKEQERKIQLLDADIEKYKSDLESDRAKATEICPPIATKRTDSSIENEIRQIQRRVEEEEEVHGNEREVMETYKGKKERYDQVMGEVRQLRNYLSKLDEVMERRQEAYLKMRKDIASRTKYYFIILLFQRKYGGKMMFDFDKKTLDILVKTEGGVKVDQAEGKDLKALSGGERSFSTVCFILSLWEAMEAPFRCLDEFDVFMDMVNRQVSMDMMLETADMHKDMQFVFLTPQDMRSLRKIDNVKIFRMPDPERSQKTLNFSQNSTVSS